jgi:hypothetical protein
MKRLTLLFSFLLFNASLAAAPSLTPVWQTPAELKDPESVIYHANSGSLFVSNVNGQPSDADGNGFISRLNIKGEIVKLDWLTGLNAPKGMAIKDNLLYVSDINELVVIDIKQQKIIKKYLAEDAKFLNDVAVDKDGVVYVSGFMTNRLYRLRGGEFKVWIEDSQLESPNGLLVEGDKLIIGSWGVMTDGFATDVAGHLKIVDLDTGKTSSLGNQTPVGNLDGVESDGKGNYYVTDWLNGALLHIQPNGESRTLIALKQGSADHTVVREYRLIIIPMMLDGTLLAFKVQ